MSAEMGSLPGGDPPRGARRKSFRLGKQVTWNRANTRYPHGKIDLNPMFITEKMQRKSVA